MKEIILASGSPRRKELMDTLGYPYQIIVSNTEEKKNLNLPIALMIEDIAYQKANAVFQQHQEAVVIGSDTVVVCENEILGKPKNIQQARDMMNQLKNRSHQVITSIVMLSKEKQLKDYDETTVYFDDISEKDIEQYILTDEPYDKAGGYAIQGWAGKYINKIEGNYYTIVGFPINKVYKMLKEMMEE